MPDDVYRAARIRAAERGSSVSALLAAYLRSLSDRETEVARLEAQQRRVQGEIARFNARDRLGRDELHARTTAVTLAALGTRQRFGISYWDAAILESSRALGCDVVLSEDLAAGQDYTGVRVENPFHGR